MELVDKEVMKMTGLSVPRAQKSTQSSGKIWHSASRQKMDVLMEAMSMLSDSVRVVL